MTTDPTPPPPFKIIPKEYLLNGGIMPNDAIVSTEAYPKFRPSVLAGTAPVHQCNGTKLALERKATWFASAQLDHPCFAGTPSGAQEATVQAAGEPASMEPIKSTAEGMSAVGKVLFPAYVAKHGTLTPRDEPQPEKGGEPCRDQNSSETVSADEQTASSVPVASNTAANVLPGGEGKCNRCDADPKSTAVIRHMRNIDPDWYKNGPVEECIEARSVSTPAPTPSTPAPCAAEQSDSADLIARVRELAIAPHEEDENKDFATLISEGISRKAKLADLAPVLADLCEQQQARIAELEKGHGQLQEILSVIQARRGNGCAFEEVIQELKDIGEAESYLSEGQYEGADGINDVVMFLVTDLSAERQKREELEELHTQQVANITLLEQELSTLRAENSELHKDKSVFEAACNAMLVELRNITNESWRESMGSPYSAARAIQWCKARAHVGINAAITAARAKGEQG